LAIHGLPIHLLSGSLGIFLAVKSHECEAFTGVVDVGDHAKLLELGLEIAVCHVLVHPIDEEFAALLSHDDEVDDVWILRVLDSVRQRL